MKLRPPRCGGSRNGCRLPAQRRLGCRQVDSGAIYNTVVYDSRSLTVEIDLAAMRGTLSAVSYLDTST